MSFPNPTTYKAVDAPLPAGPPYLPFRSRLQVNRSTDGGRTWRRSVPPQHNASLDPYIWLDEKTGSLFASDIDPPVTCTPISRSDDDGKTWRWKRPF